MHCGFLLQRAAIVHLLTCHLATSAKAQQIQLRRQSAVLQRFHFDIKRFE